MVSHINSHPTTKGHLETLFSEVDGKGHREVIQSLWEQETNRRDCMEFLNSIHVHMYTVSYNKIIISYILESKPYWIVQSDAELSLENVCDPF